MFGVIYGVYVPIYTQRKIGECVGTNYSFFYYTCPSSHCSNCIVPTNNCLNFSVIVDIPKENARGISLINQQSRSYDANYYMKLYPLNRVVPCQYDANYVVWFDFVNVEPFFITMIVFCALLGASIVVFVVVEIRQCFVQNNNQVSSV